MHRINQNGSISGKLFFFGVVAVAVFVVLFAKGGDLLPQTDEFVIPNNSALFGAGFDSNTAQKIVVNETGVEVYFCPRDECANKLIQRIDSANSSIYIAIYSFTHDEIASALIRAKERGLDVRVVFDYDQSKNDSSDDEKLQMSGILVALRNGSGYMHNKFTVIDGNIVATGSFNYSQNADTRNDENLIFIVGEGVAVKYKKDFDRLWELSNAS